MAINQPTTSGFKTRRTVLPYSLLILVYFVHKILNDYSSFPTFVLHFVHDTLTSFQEPYISTVYVLSLSILVPTHFTLYYYFSSTINQSTTCVFKTRRTIFPSSLPTLVHFVHDTLTSSQEPYISTVCVFSLSILFPHILLYSILS